MDPNADKKQYLVNESLDYPLDIKVIDKIAKSSSCNNFINFTGLLCYSSQVGVQL